MLKRSSPIFAVTDVPAAVAFYRDVLGFRGDWLWGEPPTFGGVSMGEISVMFIKQPQIAANVEGHQHHFFCDDLETLYQQHLSLKAPIIEPIENKSWGIREYTVRDLNGYHLRFSGPLKYDKPPTAIATMPAYIRLENRFPTFAEYNAIHESVDWGPAKEYQAIYSRTLAGIVAVDSRSGQAIGTLRIIRDAPSWFSIWDVMVRPEYQSQRIGSAMIEAAIAHVKTIISSGIIHLFTTKNPFYQKLGFKPEESMVYRF